MSVGIHCSMGKAIYFICSESVLKINSNAIGILGFLLWFHQSKQIKSS